MLLIARSETEGAVTYVKTVNAVVRKVSSSPQTNGLVKTSTSAVVEMVVVTRFVSTNKVHISAHANQAIPLNLMAKSVQISTNVLAAQTFVNICVRIRKEATGVLVWKDLSWLTIDASMIVHLTFLHQCVHLIHAAGNIVRPIVMPNVSPTIVVDATPDFTTKGLERR